MAIIVSNEIDRQPKMPKATRTANTMEVGLAVLGEIKVDNDVDRLDIDASCEEVGCDEVPCSAISEFVKDPVAVGLLHLGVNVIARVSKLCDLLSEKLNTIHRIAKDDTLVDLKLGEKCVETMNLLALFDIRIELGDTAKRQFVHKIDTVRIRDKLLTEAFHSHRKCSAKQTDLVVGVAAADDLFQHWLKLR